MDLTGTDVFVVTLIAALVLLVGLALWVVEKRR
jgi:hypothetical protein